MSSSAQIRFDFKHVRRTGKYGLGKLDVRQRRILERKLRDYEKHTAESFRRSKGANPHPVDFGAWKNAPSEQQQIRVRQEVSVDAPDLDSIWRFRVSGKMRALGYWDENKFFIVWVDPNHEMGS